MSSVNPYSPPRAHVEDVDARPQRYSQPKVWSASGRIGRLRYLAYMMVGYLMLVFVMGIGSVLLGRQGSPVLMTVFFGIGWVFYMVLFVLSGIQRAHDMDWSGWTVLVTLIPLVGLIWVFKAGSAGENQFGAPPPPNTTGVKVGAWSALVIPVMGILAAIALPAYQEYTVRAKAAQVRGQ